MRRVSSIALLMVLAVPSAARAEASAADLGMRSRNGRGVILAAESCGERVVGPSAATSAHYRFSGPVHGAPVPLATTFEQAMDVHRPGPRGPGFMDDDTNAFVIVTPRGDLYARQEAGSCAEPSVDMKDSPDGVLAAGNGTWTVSGGTRSFEGAAGGGAFDFRASFGPAVDNALRMDLSGRVTVRAPGVSVGLDRVLWAHLIDWVFNQVTVAYVVSNDGEGDAYNVRLDAGPNVPASVETLGDPPGADIGRLGAGEAVEVALRYRMPQELCVPPRIGCSFATTTILASTDALDAPSDDLVEQWLVDPPLLPL